MNTKGEIKEARITIEHVSQPKKSKNGKPFISVKDSAGVWHSVWEKDLFNAFKKDETYVVLREQKGGFSNIRDVVSDDAGIIPSKTSPGEDTNPINESDMIKRILELVKEGNELLLQVVENFQREHD